jgi:hypothetical protein
MHIKIPPSYKSCDNANTPRLVLYSLLNALWIDLSVVISAWIGRLRDLIIPHKEREPTEFGEYLAAQVSRRHEGSDQSLTPAASSCSPQ